MSNEKPPFEVAIQDVPESWRYRWCGGSFCACMGAANCSGGMSGKGYTHEEWQGWVSENPNPNPPKPFDEAAFRAAFEPVARARRAASLAHVDSSDTKL